MWRHAAPLYRYLILAARGTVRNVTALHKGFTLLSLSWHFTPANNCRRPAPRPHGCLLIDKWTASSSSFSFFLLIRPVLFYFLFPNLSRASSHSLHVSTLVFMYSFLLLFRLFNPLFPTSYIYCYLAFSISRYPILCSSLLSVPAVSFPFPFVRLSWLAFS
jgi:hypothetical protein